MDWLLIPELMLPGKFHPVYELLPLEVVQIFVIFQLILAKLQQLHPLHFVDLLLGRG